MREKDEKEYFYSDFWRRYFPRRSKFDDFAVKKFKDIDDAALKDDDTNAVLLPEIVALIKEEIKEDFAGVKDLVKVAWNADHVA